MGQIVDGRKIANEIQVDLKLRVENLKAKNMEAALAVILVGDDKPSHTYVKKKGDAAASLGIAFFKYEYPADITKAELIVAIEKIQKNNKLTGMILQLPVPDNLWPHTRELANHIKIDIDVDCLSHTALGRVMMNESLLVPPTPGAIMHILKYHGVDLKNKEVCLVGRGDLIGKPLAAMLASKPVTLNVCGSSTTDLARYTKTADIIITGVGKKNLIKGDMVKAGSVVIDAGVCYVGNKMYGDIDFSSVKVKVGLVTPTPGGVGPVTVAKLLENTVKVAENNL